MKKIVRSSTFETNSSSTHSLTMCTKEIYEKWKKGEILFDKWNETFKELKESTEEEVRKEYFERNTTKISNGVIYKNTYYQNIECLVSSDVQIPEDKLKSIAESMNDGLYTFDNYWAWCGLETFEETYTTPSGETIIAFGEYGYDG